MTTLEDLTRTPDPIVVRLAELIGHAAFGAEAPDWCKACAESAGKCAEHEQPDKDSRELDKLREAIERASSDTEAWRITVAGLARIAGVQRQPTPAQVEFAASAMHEAARWPLGITQAQCDVRDAREHAAGVIAAATTYEEIGIAVTGGAGQ
jgi:hypothetical protein